MFSERLEFSLCLPAVNGPLGNLPLPPSFLFHSLNIDRHTYTHTSSGATLLSIFTTLVWTVSRQNLQHYYFNLKKRNNKTTGGGCETVPYSTARVWGRGGDQRFSNGQHLHNTGNNCALVERKNKKVKEGNKAKETMQRVIVH